MRREGAEKRRRIIAVNEGANTEISKIRRKRRKRREEKE
jgi:hypothetical protein